MLVYQADVSGSPLPSSHCVYMKLKREMGNRQALNDDYNPFWLHFSKMVTIRLSFFLLPRNSLELRRVMGYYAAPLIRWGRSSVG
jgi:hypothetical protein